MPELPEVETIRRDLERHLRGRQVLDLVVRDTRLLNLAQEQQLRSILLGQSWERIERKGKYLQIFLANGWQVVFHLRMTGQLILCPRKRTPAPYRCLMIFDQDYDLAFCDQRRFGEIRIVPPGQEDPSIRALGPDPSNGLQIEDFVRLVKGRTTRIQPLLMDQHVLAGVGNIYAQEALYRAGIRPSRLAHRITAADARRLYEVLRDLLLQAITCRGSSSRNYRDAFGQTGTAQTLHLVYRKGGRPCSTCGRLLKAVRVGGRGTVYCPHCQK